MKKKSKKTKHITAERYPDYVLRRFGIEHLDVSQSKKVKCPAHGDSKPSLSITLTQDKILLNCLAGCDTEKVLETVDLTFTDSFSRTFRRSVAGYDYNIDGNCKRFTDQNRDRLLYCEDLGKWLYYDSQHWNIREGKAQAMHFSRITARNVAGEFRDNKRIENDSDLRKDFFKWAHRCVDERIIGGVVRLVQNDPEMRISQDKLDQREHLFNCLNGTIDLKTGILQPHNPKDYITQMAPVNYPFEVGKEPNEHYIKALTESWRECLNTWMQGDTKVIKYLQSIFGYCLTGHTMEKLFVIFTGKRDSGKSTCIDTITELLGDYATLAPRTLLKDERWDRHPTEIETLRGKRFVQMCEPEKRTALKVGLAKAFSGDRFIQSRGMRQDFSLLHLQAKFAYISNHDPEVKDGDDAIWSRLKKVSWKHSIPKQEQNPDLGEELKSEWSGILAWMVQGSVNWYKTKRIITPKTVIQDTEEFRKQENPAKEFADECLVKEPTYHISNTDLYEAYKDWCRENRKEPMKKSELFASMRALGYKQLEKIARFNGRVDRGWKYIKLKV
jgi:putative DNA primase/helicase